MFTGMDKIGSLARNASTSFTLDIDGGGACFLCAARKSATFVALTAKVEGSITGAAGSVVGTVGSAIFLSFLFFPCTSDPSAGTRIRGLT
jgi:hypothetical protein